MTSRMRSPEAGRWLRRAAARGAFAALAALAAAAQAHAGQDPGIRVGYYDGADSDEAALTVGIFGRLDIPGPLNLELSADYRREKLLDGDLEATVIPVRATAILSFLPVVSPYLSAGVGVDYLNADFHGDLAGSGAESSFVLEVHAGAGVEVSVGPVSVIGDLRYCSVGKMSSDAVSRALGHDYDPSGWSATLSAGISF
jgi:hypothetical protein